MQEISDFEVLTNMHKLKHLVLHRAPRLSTVAPIRHMRDLEMLHLVDSDVTDLMDQIADLFPKVQDLQLGNMPSFVDLAPLSRLTLTDLYLIGNPVRDLRPLVHQRALRHLWLMKDKKSEYQGLTELSPRVKVHFAEY